MPKKKPSKKKAGKKKPAGGKKVSRRKKPVPRNKPARSKAPSEVSPAEIHQGVGPAPGSAPEIVPGSSGDASK